MTSPRHVRSEQATSSRNRRETEPDREFLLLEYESLRQEQLEKITETFRLTRFALITHGAIWTWLATNRDTIPSSEVATWSPVLLILLFGGLYWTLRRDIRVIGDKVRELETHFSVPVGLAWEKDLSGTYTRTVALHWVLWTLLLVANVLIAVLLGTG